MVARQIASSANHAMACHIMTTNASLVWFDKMAHIGVKKTCNVGAKSGATK